MKPYSAYRLPLSGTGGSRHSIFIMLMAKQAGLVMPLFSLRSDEGWGVGEVGDLVGFSRWAAQAGFSSVMLLPFHEVWPGETSPYGAVSAFALDPIFVSLNKCEDFLALGGEAEVLTAAQKMQLAECRNAPSVQWETIRALKTSALRASFDHFKKVASGTDRYAQFEAFKSKESTWLDDYALYHAIASDLGPGWAHWPQGLRDRTPEAMTQARLRLASGVEYRQYVEWLLTQQWTSARAEALKVGVDFGGDLPFVVSRDAADVWANQRFFQLDLRLGAPPDEFSAEGQDWGLPVYNWSALKSHDYQWLRVRAKRSNDLCGLWRIDHVVGLFRSYYKTADGSFTGFLPPDEPSQIEQGRATLAALSAAGHVLAEDLGVIPPFVRAALSDMGIPGFRVLRWERDGAVHRDPSSWPETSVATTGTHDTDTQAEWWQSLPDHERQAITKLPGLERFENEHQYLPEVRDALLRLVYSAPSRLTLVPFQDAVGLSGRVNLPGSVSPDNWTYRMPMTVAQLLADETTSQRLSRLSRETGRHR
jgi:4-alpha-glucanotransferase